MSSTIEVKGGKALIVALRKYDTDLAKAVNKRIKSYLEPVKQQARSYLPLQAPLSNWGKPISSADTINYRPFPRYDVREARRGVNYTTTPSKPNRRGFVYLAQIYNHSAGGAIFETAGRKFPNGRPTYTSMKKREGGNQVWQYSMRSGKQSIDYYESNNPLAGYQFIHSMPELYKVPRKANQSGRLSRMMNGRVIFKAWGMTYGKVTPKVIQALIDAKHEFDTGKKAA